MGFLDKDGLLYYHSKIEDQIEYATDLSKRTLTWGEIADDIANDRTYKYGIGDRLVEPWTDTAANQIYNNPWRINHFETCEIDGGEKKGMWLENMYTSPFGVQFSHSRAILRCPDGLAAGTYYFTFESKNGNYISAGDVVCFTSTVAVPKGGCVAGLENSLTSDKANWHIRIYAADRKTELETIAPTFTADGTQIGVIKTSTRNGDINSVNEINNGWNYWLASALRQYLNSEAGVGDWWTPYDGWDLAPNELDIKAGFLSGIPSDMKAVMLPVKNVTKNVLNGGYTETTYDKVGIMSLEQMYIKPQTAGDGEPHEWYKAVNGTDTKFEKGSLYKYRELIRKSIDDTKQTYISRSAYQGSVCSMWSINADGYAIYYNAFLSLKFIPIVFIGK